MIKLLSLIIPVWNREDFILRALESVPKRNDIEIIIVDDNSTDNTNNIILEWRSNNISLFNDIIIIVNSENLGVGKSKKKAYEIAKGRFIYVLDSDDFIITDTFNYLLNNINKYDDYDIIRICNEINSGKIEKTSHTAGWSYILRNRFKNIKYPEVRKAEDWLYWLQLKNNGAKIVDTDYICYHYNYPHEGSLVWEYEHGKIDWKGDKL